MKGFIRSFFDRKWKSITLLSIIVPVSLLLTFRITGVLPEPTQPETTELETITWNTTRPGYTMSIRKNMQQIYQNDIISFNFTLYIWGYSEGNYRFGEPDTLYILPYAGATVNEGFIHSIVIRFSRIDDYADLLIMRNLEMGKSHNAEVKSISDTVQTRYPYVEAYGVNQPRDCLLMRETLWLLSDEKNGWLLSVKDHWITITSEITYFDGKIYRKIIAPITFGMLAYDNNNSFDTAQQVAPNILYEWLLLTLKDKEDYYKIWIKQGQQLTITMTPEGADFDLYLYDRDRILQASSENRGGVPESVSIASAYEGWWYIKVKQVASIGYYSLTVETHNPVEAPA